MYVFGQLLSKILTQKSLLTSEATGQGSIKIASYKFYIAKIKRRVFVTITRMGKYNQ